MEGMKTGREGDIRLGRDGVIRRGIACTWKMAIETSRRDGEAYAMVVTTLQAAVADLPDGDSGMAEVACMISLSFLG